MDMDGKTALHWTANNPDDTTVKALLVHAYNMAMSIIMCYGFLFRN